MSLAIIPQALFVSLNLSLLCPLLFFRWYPPGHGDIYESFYNSGLLQQFIDQGKEICFVSNIDNLGATVDVNILPQYYSLNGHLCMHAKSMAGVVFIVY